MPGHGHGHSLTAAAAGSHGHTVTGSAASAGSHQHAVSLTTSTNGAHWHGPHFHQVNYNHDNANPSSGILGWVQGGVAGDYGGQMTTANGDHDHAVGGDVGVGGTHTHSVSGTTDTVAHHAHAIAGSVGNAAVNGDANFATASGGAGNTQAANPPFLALNFIIKTGARGHGSIRRAGRRPIVGTTLARGSVPRHAERACELLESEAPPRMTPFARTGVASVSPVPAAKTAVA